MEPTKSILAIEDVTFSYENTRAVDRVSLRVPPGSVVGLIGPNGSGKSTTLKLTAGLIRPVTLIDEAINGLDPETVLSMEALISRMSARGHSFLIATQNVDFAERLCDAVYMVVDGDIFAEGSPSAIKSTYGVRELIDVFSEVGLVSTSEEIRDVLDSAAPK